MTFCGGCGVQAVDGDIYCGDCGRKLRSRGVASPEPAGNVPVASGATVVVVPPTATSTPRVRATDQPIETRGETVERVRRQLGIHTGVAEDKVLVDIVFPRTPAFTAGLRTGDIIVAVGQVSVQTMNEFIDAVRDIDLGERYTLAVDRDRVTKVLVVDPHAPLPKETPTPPRVPTVTSTTSRQSLARSRERRSATGLIVLGVILVVAGVYFGNYALQNFACSYSSAFGVKPPVSCTWYQFAYGSRDWCIGVGAFFGVAGLAGLFLNTGSRT